MLSRTLLRSQASKRLKTLTRQLSVTNDCIIKAPFEPVVVPSIPLHEYVWRNISKWEDKIALECAVTGKKLTYREARGRSRKLASALQTVFKLKKGDSIAINAPNLPDYPLLLLAASEAGLIPTTINPLYTADEIAKQLIDSDAKLFITIPATTGASAAASNKIGKELPIIVIQDLPDTSIPKGTISFEELLNSSSGDVEAVRDFNPDDTTVLPYSSGTTGLPKGVELTHRNLVANLEEMAHPDVRLLFETSENIQDSVLAVLPMYHIYGMVVVSLSTLLDGGKLVTMPRFEPGLFLQSLVKHKIGLFYAVPPLLIFMGSHPAVKPEMLQYIRAINSGAAPLGQKDYEKLLERAPQIEAYQGYGLTETSPGAARTHKDRRHKYASCGCPFPNTDIIVVDINTAKALPSGQRGELYVRGPQVMKGYLNKPEANNEAFSDGWLRTGDIAYYDEDGDLFVVDRFKELIKVKGYQVAPAELEELLRSHPDVLDAAVVGVPDERAGEVPRGFVVPKPNSKLTKEDIVSFVAGQVAEYKQLAGGVEFIEAIPKSAAGKILRKDLKR